MNMADIKSTPLVSSQNSQEYEVPSEKDGEYHSDMNLRIFL